MRRQPSKQAARILADMKQLVAIVDTSRDSFDRDRRLPPSLVDAMYEIGLFSLWLPREFGGPELDLLDTARVLEEASRLDGAIGWCAGIATSNSRFAAFLPPGTARKMFLEDRAIVAGSFVPTGTATPAPDGYRVTGRWGFGSGIRHCKWLVGACSVVEGGVPRLDADGAPAWKVMFFPRECAEIIDTWDVGGLRGTGSHDFRVTDLLVPAAYAVDGLGTTPTSGGSLYSVPVFSALATVIAAVPLGIARAALDNFAQIATTKIPRSGIAVLREDPVTETAIGRAEAILRAARAFLHDVAEEISDFATTGTEVTLHKRALMRLATSQAASAAKEAVQLVYDAGGGTSIYESGGLQRCFRDLHAAVQHVQVQSVNYKFAGRVMLGLDPGTPRF